MINYDDVTKESMNEHNPNLLQIPNHLYRILIIGGPGSRRTRALLNLVKKQDDDDYSVIDKVYLYVKYPSEAKYQYLITIYKKMALKNWKIQRFY